MPWLPLRRTGRTGATTGSASCSGRDDTALHELLSQHEQILQALGGRVVELQDKLEQLHEGAGTEGLLLHTALLLRCYSAAGLCSNDAAGRAGPAAAIWFVTSGTQYSRVLSLHAC